MCELWGRLSALSAHSSRDAERRPAISRLRSIRQQDVARRQAPQHNTTVNARRIACVNARALKRVTVDTTSKSQR